jgi:hypothetical protein
LMYEYDDTLSGKMKMAWVIIIAIWLSARMSTYMKCAKFRENEIIIIKAKI